MVSPLIIGLSGKAGSGKDTVAGFIQEYFKERNVNWKPVAYGDKLKQICSILTGLPISVFYDQLTKEILTLPPQWNHFKLVTAEGKNRGMYLDKAQAENMKRIVDLSRKESDFLSAVNVEESKTTPRVLLQLLGSDILRQHGSMDIWVNALWSDYYIGHRWIVTDVRFENEWKAITDRGGVVIRIERPEPNVMDHISESALDKFGFDHVIHNTGTLADLKSAVEIKLDELFQ